ncbi:zf-CCHC domain-containing protein [Tanacetum coccineum]
MHQTFEKRSLAITHKLDDMIELLKKTNKEDLEYEMVRVKIPMCMSWLGSTNAYDEPISSLGMMDNEVGNPSPQSTPQVLPSFEEYTPPVTNPTEVEETIGIPMEVEPLDETQLEDLGLNTCNPDIPLSSREVPEPQPNPSTNCPSLNVTTIEESKDSSSLVLDELIGNLKVHEVVMEKDSEIYRGKKERVKSITLKAKKESSDDETSTSGSDDEEYAMAVRNFKKFFRRKGKFVRQPREEKKSFRQRDEKKGKSDQKCFRCGDPNHLIGDCPKPSRNKDQKAFIGGS